MAMVTAAGCSGGDDGSGSPDSADLTWQFWVGGSEDKASWNQVAERVTEEHPGIKVKLQGVSWDSYWSKIGTQLASGDAPCIVGMQSLRVSKFGNALAPLDDLMEKYGVQAGDFDDAILDGLKSDGKQVALPYDTGPTIIFYNRDAFADAGVPEPEPGWSVADFEAAAAKLSTDGKHGVAIEPNEGSLPWVRTFNGAQPVEDGALDLTAPKFVQGYQDVIDMVQEDKVAPEPAGDPYAFKQNQFMSGKAAMMADGPWAVITVREQVKFKLGVAPMPAGPDGSQTFTAGSGFGISQSCENKDAAFQAIASMTGQESLSGLAAAGRAYPARPAAQDAWYQAAEIAGARETLAYAASHSAPLVTSDNWLQAAEAWNRFGSQAANGDISAEEALQQVQDNAGS
jgi:ABC-type glycerol-3-phosphate transport system substrate-binding protein